MASKRREYRQMSAVLKRSEEGPEFVVSGYATTFDDPYVLYSYDGTDYIEQIDRNALDGADMSDVIMQYNHEGKVLARQSNGTLDIKLDDHGMFITADLSKSQAARDMYEEIQSGLVTKMSWAFTIEADEYDRKTHTRTITKVGKVYDVSAVSLPADPNTEISARDYFNGVIEAEQTERSEREKRIRKLKLLAEV